MSTLKTNNVQVGQSVTATNNFTIYQPDSPDGTVRIGVGNSGATTGDAVTINSTGIVKGTLVSGTAVSASSTSVNFTGIPSTAKRITVMFSGVGTNGASLWQFQLGSGSVTTSGYNCFEYLQQNTGTPTVTARTSGFVLNANNASIVMYGSITFENITANTWVARGTFTGSGAANSFWASCGSIVLSGTLDRVRITTVNGTDVFDAGTINIMWEG